MRSLKTLDALLLLADAGYGPQAMMLSRTVFEDAVIGWWCSVQEPEKLLKLLAAHEKSVSLQIQRDRPGRDEFEALARVQILDEEQLSEIARQEDIDRVLARRLWTGLNVRQMVDELGDILSQSDVAVLNTLFDVSYLLTNLVMHHSPASAGAGLSVASDDSGRNLNTFSRRPSTRFVHDALTVAFNSLSLLANLVSPDASRDRLRELIAQHRSVFVVLRTDITRLGRNEPCPCGSGKKLKRCHGR
jgi:hypothetical protein